MKRKDLDLVGEVFGEWVVMSKAPNKGKKKYWTCECKCSVRFDVEQTNLVRSKSKMCRACSNKKSEISETSVPVEEKVVAPIVQPAKKSEPQKTAPVLSQHAEYNKRYNELDVSTLQNPPPGFPYVIESEHKLKTYYLEPPAEQERLNKKAIESQVPRGPSTKSGWRSKVETYLTKDS